MNRKTVFDVVDIFFTEMVNSGIGTSLSGDIYKWQRPDNSSLEDIVINSLPINNDDVQQCTVNVNCHCQDMKINAGGVTQYHTDTLRLQEIADAVIETLNEGHGETYNWYLDMQSVIPEPDIFQHFINLRYEFYNHQIDTEEDEPQTP